MPPLSMAIPMGEASSVLSAGKKKISISLGIENMNPFQEGVDNIKPALGIGGDAIWRDNGCFSPPDNIVGQSF